MFVVIAFYHRETIGYRCKSYCVAVLIGHITGSACLPDCLSVLCRHLTRKQKDSEELLAQE